MSSRLFITKDIKSPKDNQLANCMNYLYYHKLYNPKSNTDRWICTNKKCYASITTNNLNEVIKIKGLKLEEDASQQLTKSHDHEAQEQIYIDNIQSLNNLKIQAKQKTASSLSTIYI
jgi:hypothetical protein